MATVTHRISTAATTNVSSYASGAFTPAVGDLLVAFVVSTDTVAAGTMTGTGAGQSFTKVGSYTKAATAAGTIYCFVSNILTTVAASQTVTFDCTGDAATGAVIQVFSISGMTRTALNGAVRQFNGVSNQAAGTPAPAFSSAALTGNVCAGVVGNATNPATMTAPGSWTEGNDTGYATPTTGAEYIYRNSGFTGTTVTWGSASATGYGAMIVEFDTTAAPKMATLVDDFNAGALDTTLWTDDGVSVSQSGGAAHINADDYGRTGFWSDNFYDLTNSEIVVEIPALPTTDVGDGPFFGITLSAGPTNDPVNERLKWFWYSSSAGVGDWDPQYQNTGATSSGTGVTNSSATRWLRIKHDGTNVLWDTSPDGTTWTNRRSVAIATVAVPFTAMRASFSAGADAATSGTFDVGNVNTLGSTTHEAAAALAVTSTTAAAATATHEGLAARAVTSTLAAAAVAAHEGLAARAVTATLAAAATVTEAVWSADAALAVTATRAAAAVAVHEASAALSITATSTAAATRTADAAGSLAVTVAAAASGGRVQEAVGALALSSAGAAAAARSSDATAALAVTATQQAAAFITREAVSSLLVTAARAAAGVAIHEGLAAASVTAARASLGYRDQPATAALAATATAAVATQQTAEAVASLVVTMFADAAAEGVEGELEAEGNLDVTAALSASASRTVAADAARAVSAALVAAATRTVPAAGALSATATSAAAATATHAASASLTVAVDRVAGAEKTGTQDAQAALSATASLTAAAVVVKGAAASQTITAALSGAAERGRNTSAVGVVSAALTAEAEVVRAAEAVLVVTALELASAGRFVTAESALDVTADLAAGASSIRPDIEVDLSVPVEDHGILVPVGAGSATMVLNRRETTVSVGTREV
jgi:hypothetical protein